MNELITKSFAAQCLAFPDKVERALATIDTVEGAKELLDKASAMKTYADRLKAGIEIERPIAIGVLKIKVKLGELLPAKPPKETGAMKGKKGSKAELLPFTKPTISAYRKLAANRARLEAYYESIDDVPTQADFIRFCGADGSIKSNQNRGVVEWYTPAQYIDAARKVMGSIDLDPATSDFAQKTVAAKKHYTVEDDGLSQDWSGNVWLNPPFKMPEVAQFIDKLCQSIDSGAVKHAVVVTNNNTDTKWWHKAASVASAMCFTKGRIKWYNSAQPDCSPTNGQTFFYCGSRKASFIKSFRPFGLLVEVTR
jgi:phage N-6-adenine-methyltransferase